MQVAAVAAMHSFRGFLEHLILTGAASQEQLLFRKTYYRHSIFLRAVTFFTTLIAAIPPLK